MALVMAQPQQPNGIGIGGPVDFTAPQQTMSSLSTVATTTTTAILASFWEPGGYKPNLRRIVDSNQLCNDFIALVNDRADIEAKYASLLRKFSEKWNTLIDKGPEYGSMQSCWKSVLIACDRLAAVHAAMSEEMLNESLAGMKQWQKQNMIKQTLTRDLKFRREIEDEFKRAQKSWEKLLREVADTKADYFHCCQKEKSSIVRERNMARDQSVSVEQRHRYEDETHKLTDNKQRAREKYARAVRELAYATPKYKDDMQRVFSKCQEREAARMEFFKQMFFKLHDCLDLSARPQVPEIFSEFYLQIDKGDAEADLGWWEKTWGPAMPMFWPTEFEEYRDDANKNLIGNNNPSNNKAKLANIVPIQTSPAATNNNNNNNSKSFTLNSTNDPSAAAPSSGKSSATKEAELLARQATALMNAVRVPGDTSSSSTAPTSSASATILHTSTQRPVTAPLSASSGIALTSFKEHSEILPTVRVKPKQSRAQLAVGGRTLPWAAADGESSAPADSSNNNNNNTRSRQYDFKEIGPSNSKIRAAFSEYQLNNVADDDEEDEHVRRRDSSRVRSHQPAFAAAAVGQRRSRGSVAEYGAGAQHGPFAAANGVDARRASVIVLSKEEQNKLILRGQTLQPGTSANLSSSSFSSKNELAARQQRSSTLYNLNAQQNFVQNGDDTPPPTYDRPHRNGATTGGSGRAHAVGAIGRAASKRYAYAAENDGHDEECVVNGGSGGDSSLERNFVLQSNAEIETSTTTTTEPYSNVIAEMHEKLNKVQQRHPSSTHRSANSGVVENVPKLSTSSSQHSSSRSAGGSGARKSRSRSRSRASRGHGQQQQQRAPSSSSQDRAVNTDPILAVDEKNQTSPPHKTNTENSKSNEIAATSGNVRAKIKSFTSITKITAANEMSVNAAKSTTNNIQAPSQQQQPMAVSPESGAASSIDSSESTNNNSNAHARVDNTPSSAAATSAVPSALKTFAASRAQNSPAKLSSANINKPQPQQNNNFEWESESADSALDDAAARRRRPASGHHQAKAEEDVICMVKAIYDYNAEELDEISLRLGEVLAKTQDEDAQGWCKGRKLDGREGLFPASFVANE